MPSSLAADSAAADGHAHAVGERVRRMQHHRLAGRDTAEDLRFGVVTLAEVDRLQARDGRRRP